MTLVLAYIDAGVTLHVADRRLTVPDGKTYKVSSEDAVKVDVFKGTFLLSYSGRSLIRGKPTLDWLQNNFDSQLNMQGNLDQIASKLDLIFEGMQYRTHFLIVTLSGWALDDDDKLMPFVGTITNQDPSTLKQLPNFKPLAAPLHDATGNERGGWVPTGRISSEGHATVDRWVKKTLMRNVTPVAIASVFAYQVRQEARKDIDQTIGRNLRIAVLPKRVVEEAQQENAPDIFIRHHPDGVYVYDQAMTVDLPEDRRLLGMTLANVIRNGGGPSWFNQVNP